MPTLRDISSFKLLRRLASVLALLLADVAALLFGLGVSAWAWDGRSDPAIGLAPLLVAAWIVLFTAFRLYDRAPVRRSPGGLVGAAFCWAGLVILGAAIYPETGLGPAETMFAASLALLCAGSLRYLYERVLGRIYRRGFGRTPVLVIGPQEDRARLRRMMGQATGAYVLAGELDIGGGGGRPRVPEGEAGQHGRPRASSSWGPSACPTTTSWTWSTRCGCAGYP